jgi:nitrate/nitrite transporter NarK
MNNDDGTIISDTTSADSVMYTHTFPIVQTMEVPPVMVECKRNAPKLKRILRNKHEILLILHYYMTFGVTIVQSKELS